MIQQIAPVAPDHNTSTSPLLSVFPNAWATEPTESITPEELFRRIREGDWRSEVNECRKHLRNGTEEGRKAYQKAKKKLPAVNPTGKIKTRGQGVTDEQRGAVHSGFICLDFDAKDNPDHTLADLRRIVSAADFVQGVFASPGDGLKAFAKVPADFDKHLGCWEAARQRFAALGLKLDDNTADPFRLCFGSYDPDAKWKASAKELEPVAVPEKLKRERTPSDGMEDPVHVRKVLRELVDKIGVDQKRRPWLHILGATRDAVGFDLGNELVDEFFPPMKPGDDSAETPPDTLDATWGSLHGLGVNPDDPAKMFAALPDLDDPPDLFSVAAERSEPVQARRSLADFRVDHSATLRLSLEEIDALRPPYVIDGFLRRAEVALVGAESKSRKSWLVQDAGFSLATGTPWLAAADGMGGFATNKAKVHVFDLELNDSEVKYRFAKARAHRFADSPEKAKEATENVQSYSLDGLPGDEIRKKLAELKATVSPGDLVIIDCLYRLVPDGNETEKVAEILEVAKRFAKETNAGVIVVDHFRKAGDDKARNRFAGSFVKQASASTLVAIELTKDDVLVLNIDARTFYGVNRVHARFNPETYAFDSIPEAELERQRQQSAFVEEEGWLEGVRQLAERGAFTTADAGALWNVKRQSALPRLDKLVKRGWLHKDAPGPGKTTKWTLKPEGREVLNGDFAEV